MTITLSEKVEERLRAEADRQRIGPDQLVEQALDLFFQEEAALADELAGWQEIGEESLALIEETS